MTPLFWRACWLIFRKDWLQEQRSRELISLMTLFGLLSTLTFSFALQLDRLSRVESVSGILWVTILFAMILGMDRSAGNDRENEMFLAILLSPIPRAAIFVGKSIANALFALTIGGILIGLMTFLYNLPLLQPMIFLILLLLVIGLASVGTLLATMTVQTRSRSTLLPIVMLPTALPLILAAVSATIPLIAQSDTNNVGATWIQLMVVLDGVYFGLAVLLFDFVVEE
ncbi:MAG: heme exporter protein CcmB [Phototrophicaceae bacterium]